jgi:hypothetical protein
MKESEEKRLAEILAPDLSSQAKYVPAPYPASTSIWPDKPFYTLCGGISLAIVIGLLLISTQGLPKLAYNCTSLALLFTFIAACKTLPEIIARDITAGGAADYLREKRFIVRVTISFVFADLTFFIFLAMAILRNLSKTDWQEHLAAGFWVFILCQLPPVIATIVMAFQWHKASAKEREVKGNTHIASGQK